ncbi:DUF6458 family protein [Nocardioides iriomotensis]|jgi:uncharacterized membrane protein HdeD (DUF308 family)|uniref:DUF6458 domain-containing protein n=1 Tax=Nocardioides iriomotensis TaxID=715784 RepID=A0A4Q5IXV7_9ACTN|nr:DUF6458 family protein [Nocardioides iriomotensis]RYU10833.1 hypothetical protein ETU37_16460 [Nocardioides iriomotensis]
MGIGLGIVLLVIGLILVMGVVQIDIGFIDDTGLGWILVLVGALAVVLALVMNKQRSETKHVEERRYDGPPPR